MLVVENLNHDSWETVYFQRFTVIATELVLVYALHKSGLLEPSLRSLLTPKQVCTIVASFIKIFIPCCSTLSPFVSWAINH